MVIAHGGFSGLFPDSSSAAYSLAIMTSLSNVILWCDVQLTKDGAGICFPDINLQNASDVSDVFKNRKKTYFVNGEAMTGYFPNDFTVTELANVVCKLKLFYTFFLSIYFSIYQLLGLLIFLWSILSLGRCFLPILRKRKMFCDIRMTNSPFE